MQLFSGRPWLRLPLSLVVVGLLLGLLVNRLQLGWPLYVVALVVLAAGVALLVRGEGGETRSPEIALAVFCLVLVAGGWALHPQGWRAPGFAIKGSSNVLLGRLKTEAVVEDNGTVRGYDISTQKPTWEVKHTGDVTMVSRHVLLRKASPSNMADRLVPVTGTKLLAPGPWPTTVVATPTGQKVHRGRLSAQLVTAHDIAGDEYTSLVVHQRDGSVQNYRVKNVTSLSLRGGVLMLNGPTQRLLVIATS